jgi:WS/DGAT/MGAT family acyltransferase
MRQLTSLDAQFLAMETPRTYGHVGGLAVYDGKLDLRHDVCRLLKERLHLLPPFRWRLVEVPFGVDHPYWVEDPDFDLDFHVRESAVAPPGDDRQLAELVSRIFARPLDRSRPLWEVYLIHGLEGGRAAMLTKVHHSVVDGVSGAEILSVLLDLSPEGRALPPPKSEGSGERPPNDLAMLGRGLLGLPRQPLRALRALPSTAPNLLDVPGLARVPGMARFGRLASALRGLVGGPRTDPHVLEMQTAPVPRTRFNARISAHRRFSFGSISLATVKALKNELGITVNDVVVALCASAVRDWLIERDELPRDPLVSMIPVSVRGPDERGTFGNRVSMMIVPVPTDVPDPRERLLRAHEYLEGAKARHRAIPASLLTDATSFIPPAVAALAARTTLDIMARLRPPLNLVISNVPGPREPLYCSGVPLQAHFPVSVIADGVGLNITAMSYRDHIDFGIVADHDMVDDAWSLMRNVENSLDELEEAVCGAKRRERISTSTDGITARAGPSPGAASPRSRGAAGRAGGR